MNKAHPFSRIPIAVEQPVENVVAHVGPGGAGQTAWKALCPYRRCHGLHRQGGKIGVGPIGNNGQIHRLIPGIVRNGCVLQIHGNALRSHGVPAPGLTHTEDHIRVNFLRFGLHGVKGPAEGHRNFQFP